jgi:hypothetical protein
VRDGDRYDAPHAPWALAGECVVGFVADGVGDRELPQGMHRLPGPGVAIAARYDDAPVGPYLELAVGAPARLGMRAGLSITTMVVDSAGSRIGGRLNWGFPKELGRLRWSAEGDDRVLSWEERDIVLRGTPAGPAVPVVLPLVALQRRSDGPVVVRGHLRGLARVARVEITVPAGDPLAACAGAARGALVTGLRMVVNPARHATGITATLRAPLRAPEPALSWGPSGD